MEIRRADAAFKAGSVDVAAGDYIVRGDQPYRTLADMYFSVQNYPSGNPRPYDDTGWTMQYMRDIKLMPLTDTSVLQKPMTLLKPTHVQARRRRRHGLDARRGAHRRQQSHRFPFPQARASR